MVDGKEIERTKSASNNTYSIDGTDLRAFGQGVPDAVAAVLNVDDINFQDQLDPPYWLTLTSGEVSRQLNALIDLSIIDETMKNINRAQSRARVELELAEEKAKKKEIQLDEMQWVGECQMDFAVLSNADQYLAEKKIDLEDLKILTEQIFWAQTESTDARSKLSAVLEVGKLSAHIRAQQQVLDGVAGVLSTIESLQGVLQFRTVDTAAVDSAAAAVKEHSSLLQSLLMIRNQYRAAAPLAKNKEVIGALAEVDQARDSVIKAKQVWLSLESLVSQCEGKNEEMNLALLNLVLVQKEIQEKTGGLCPVCGGPLK
jgi:hypothetical protein